MDYKEGEFETRKFSARKGPYYEGLAEILSLGYETEDFIHHFPSFVGHMTLSRYLALYELYKMTLGVAGHIAEAGVYKAAGTLFFAKLTQIFEPESLTLVHGFDWFQASELTAEEPNICEGAYVEDYARVMRLIQAQKLEHIVHIHKLDLRTGLDQFFDENKYMQFKLVFLDAGLYDVVMSCLKHFWPRLEVDVATDQEFRGRGFADVVAQQFIGLCLDRKIIPTWDCFVNNTGSVRLAEKLGFSIMRRYPFYSFNIPLSLTAAAAGPK